MKEQERTHSPKRSSAHDPLSRTTFTLQAGQVLVETEGRPHQTWIIPPSAIETRSACRKYLHFATPSTSHLQINPWGNLLISHSERYQEAELSQTYSSGSVWWQFFVPHTVLSLTAGLKDKKSNQYYNFDFSFKESGRISFKLDLVSRTFKTWINGVQNQSKKPILLPEKGNWTPFVRIRQSGSTLVLNSFINDPENKISLQNVCYEEQNAAYLPEGSDERLEEVPIIFKRDESFEQMRLVGDHLLLISPHSVRVLPRSQATGQFQLDKVVQVEQSGQQQLYLLKLNPCEVSLLRQAARQWKKSLLKDLVVSSGCTWLRKTKIEWIQWNKSLYRYLGSHFVGLTSALINQVYKLSLSIASRIFSFLNISQQVNRFCEADQYLVSETDRHSLKPTSQLESTIPRHLPQLCFPAIAYQKKITGVNAVGGYLSVILQGNKLSIYSIRLCPFKIGDYIFSKAIRKQSELTECAKQADEIKGALGQPVIYKILKNCLKYADKVKPPQKLVKQLQSRREKLRTKDKKPEAKEQPSKVIPNKDLEGTLIQMGFDHRVVKKALIQSNNASLEAAMDLILGGTIVVEDEKPPVPTKDWTCQVCTLVNAKTSLVCCACEAPIPIIPQEIQEKMQQKYEQPQMIEEEIASQKLQQNLSQVFLFPTGIAIAPIVAAGVFQSTVRFRLIGLNPRFFSSCYLKGDRFADLVTSTYHEYAGSISSQGVEKLLAYLSPEECRQRSLSWIVLQDIDVHEKSVKSVEFKHLGLEKAKLRFSATLCFGQSTRTLYFSLDTNKAYLEKQRSMVISPQLKEVIVMNNEQQKKIANALSSYKHCFQTQGRAPSQFDVILSNSNKKALQVSQINLKPGQGLRSFSLLPLYVAECYQQTANYPQLGFTSPWREAFEARNLRKTGVILSTLKGKLVQFYDLVLQLKNPDAKINGYFYFANDISLSPIKVNRFRFQGGVKKLVFNLERVKAKYLIVGLEPHAEDRLVELASVHAYGQVTEQLPPNPCLFRINLKDQPQVSIEASTANQKKFLHPKDMHIFASNLTHDLTVDSLELPENIQQYADLLVKVFLQTQPDTIVQLKSIEIPGFVPLRIDTVQTSLQIIKTSTQMTHEFTELFNEYMLKRDKRLLHQLISSQYLQLRDKAPLSDFKAYFQEYLVSLTFDKNQRNDVRLFLGQYLSSIIKQKDSIKLSDLIDAGLRSKDLTANGLEILTWLNRQSSALSTQQLSSILFETISEISKRNPNKQYDIYSEQSMFSPYLYTLGQREEGDSGMDKLQSRIHMQKLRYSRLFTIDLFRCYRIRELQLYFQKTSTNNKMLIKLSWYNQAGKIDGNVSIGYDYSVWKSLAFQKKAINRSLGIPLQSFNIQSRYLQVEISFTIVPFTACKSEIYNLADNQIIPSLYGFYISQRDSHSGVVFEEDLKALHFIKRVGVFSKYMITSSVETFLYNHQKVEAMEESLQMLKNSLQLQSNKEKWISIMMKSASQNNSNYYYTLFAVLAQEIIRANTIGNPSPDANAGFVSMMNRQTGVLLNLAQRVLKLIVEQYPATSLEILRLPIEPAYLNAIFKKTNPLAIPQLRSTVIKELTTKNITLARNILSLFSEVYDSKTDDLKQIYALLHSVFLEHELYEQCVVLRQKNGWLKGLQSSLIYRIQSAENGEALLKRICRSARKSEDLLQLLDRQMKSSGPSQILLAFLQELAERSKDSPIDGSELYSEALNWEDRSQSASIPSNLIERLLKVSESFVLNVDTVALIVERVFDLQQRNALWSKMKELPLLKKQGTGLVLLTFCLKYLSDWINTPQNKRGKQLELMTFISQILAFIDGRQDISSESPQSSSQLVGLLSKMLLEEVNWNGREGCRFLDKEANVHLNISYHLAKILSGSHQYSSLQSLIKWYILNHNKEEILPSTTSAIGHFSYIQAKIWTIIVKNLESNLSHAETINTITISYLNDSILLNKGNRYLAVSLRAKAFSFMYRLLKEFKNNPQLRQTISHLLNRYGLFRQILFRLESISAIENQDNKVVLEEELANSLTIQGQQRPKDWLAYRSGAKNHVFEINYEGKQQTSLYFKTQYPSWPAVIAVGFETNSGPNGTILAPKEVIIESGTSKQNMSVLGHLSLVPFQTFEGYSIKVYAINLHRIKTRFSPKAGLRSNKIIKLSFVSPYQSKIVDGAEDGSQLSASKQISYISFLSILGYTQTGSNQIPEDLQGIVGSIDLLSDARHIEDLQSLLSEPQNLSIFQRTLKGISCLLANEKYCNITHKFLLRACQVNPTLGERMLNEYLQTSNPVLSAKMVGEIVLTNKEHSISRIKKYFQQILNKLQIGVKDADIMPYLDNFSQTFSTLHRNWVLAPTSAEIIPCEIAEQHIQNILAKSAENISFRRLATIILTSQPPLIFNYSSQTPNFKQKLWQELYSSTKASDNELLGTIINSDNTCREWFDKNDYLNSTFKQIFESLRTNNEERTGLVVRLRFLTLLCRNKFLKQAVTKAQLDLQIFEFLVQGDSLGLLGKTESKQLRESLVNFIAAASLGSQNERIIGALLKDSLNTSILEGSSKFVGEVFLPLLNSYSKTVVCMVPYSAEENKILADLSSLQHFQAPAKTELKRIDKFRLSSNIIGDAAKDALFQKIKHHTGHKWGVFKLITNHSQMSSAKNLHHLKQAIASRKQIMILISSKTNHMGLFYTRPQDHRNINALPLNKESFLFQGNKNQINILKQLQTKLTLASFLTKEEEDQSEVLQIYSYGKVAAEITFDGFGGSTINLGALKGSADKIQFVTAVQYWYFDSNSTESYEHIWANEKVFTKRLLSQLSECYFFRPEFKASSHLTLLRQEPLFEFPSSLTVKELLTAIEILGKGTKVDAHCQLRLSNGGHVNHSSTLQQLARGESGQLILDLLVDLEGVIESLDMTASNKKVQFLPVRGILKYFEENDGVKSMIKAIKKSISDWVNQVRKQKWMQYINELEKFSGFPHFFGVYLREKQTFDLLLDLLSGLPDKQSDTKWDDKEKESSQRLLQIISDILSMENSQQFRSHALKHDFLVTILGRLKILTGTYARHYEQKIQQQQIALSPQKKQTEDDGTKKVKKKKGVGYGADTNSNTKWMKGENLTAQKKQFESIQPILNLIESFLGGRSWKAPHEVVKQILNSCLLPYIEECLRAGTLLQMSKHPEKYRAILKLVRTISRQQNLVVSLVPLSPHYQPAQSQSIESLLKSLNNTSKIFLSCLSQNLSQEDKISQELANDIISTYTSVEEAVIELEAEGEEGGQLQHALSLPLDKKYRILMKELRFDYMDMKESPNKIKHHYAANFQTNYKPNQNKMIRLAQELADISTALPHQHTNAIYVRCDKDRVDFMQALIMGSNGTPYGHGAFLFDIYFDDNYPNGPPKVNLTTTGHGKIRFNPNLYACGKVCLSLLGTWRGSVSENWDPKVSTLLQVLLSIQAIIMSEEVYFNEPGFQNEQGTEEGEKKNEAYSNIVRYGNVKFAMLQNIKNPPKGFQSVIKRHFFLKKQEIMEECNKWLKYAQKRPANYIGLVNDHNSSWAAQFKKSKTQYKQMLEKAVKELEEELNKLPAPSVADLATKQATKRIKKKKENTDLKILQTIQHEQIDVSYEKKMTEDRELDINDEKVRDRWSRYIGAMGIDAVGKQAKADILVIGLGPFALEVVKNLVLSGCRKLTIVDQGDIQVEDLAGGFFYQDEDVGKKRVESILYKIRQLNSYVKVDAATKDMLTAEFVSKYTIVLSTEIVFNQQLKLSKICREKGVKFMSADCFGAACRMTNDYGKFEVLDKNGEEPVEVMIKDIEISQRGLVTLLDGVKHPYEDGETVLISQVEGMKNKQDPSKSINGLIRKVKVINFKSFQIGDTRMFEPYVRNGTIKNIKTPITVQFPPFEIAVDPLEACDMDSELEFFDFAKQPKTALLRLCFITLDQFRFSEKRFPNPWDHNDAMLFQENLKKNSKQALLDADLHFVNQFAFSCKGNLPPLCAFFGGFVSQEIIKGITQKYKPVKPSFYLNFMELLPEKEEGKEWAIQQLSEVYTKTKDREEGLSAVIGSKLARLTSESRVFMVGAGAIGCQLLKNFAMIGLGTGESGKIVLTDPDHIENSNLNRQFLFREKHISKPKSLTAAASVTLMNPKLKNHITPLLERVSESTRQIFSNRFFSSLSAVANALDNVAARRYVDQRCVQNQVALFESGTLGPKGHVQVIIPFKTESYGSQNDPVQEGQIPHCTLKLFPEQTLHCVEWARDIFGRKFALQPKALAKFLQKDYNPDSGDIKALTESLKMVSRGPKTFDDCIEYSVTKFYKYYRDDVMQLLYTYPLDAKTKNGEPFWRLPKRPPNPIEAFNPEDPLHATFVMSLAVLTAKIYHIPFPANFRSQKERLIVAKQATKIKIQQFVPSDQKAKAILKETTTGEKDKQKQKEGQDTNKAKQEEASSKNEVQLYKEIIYHAGEQFIVRAEQFQKDDDSNGHIDFIYAASNLRALNYKLEQMDWITVKLKAGRIVPALVTTTSCVAGLQTLQLLKYLKKSQVDKMRNAYLNLAVPSLQMSEPGELQKKVLKEGLSVTLWDKWELQCSEDITFGEVYDRLKKQYGLWPIGVLQGMSRVDFGKSAAEKKKFLSSKVLQKLQREEDYLDIVVLFTLSEQDDKILQGVPPVRLHFSKK